MQLLTRRWEITDGRGALHLVEGAGVVGEQPVLAPGGSYDYVSGCPLSTPSGRMVGSFGMLDANGRRFDVGIPAVPAARPGRDDMKRTHLPLNALRVFDAAARHLSFTRAADELAVTPAAVGQQIRALEDVLGVVLFRRTSKGIGTDGGGIGWARGTTRRVPSTLRNPSKLCVPGSHRKR